MTMTEQNRVLAWRLRDYSALRALPLRGRPDGRSPPPRGVVEPGLFYVGGSTDRHINSESLPINFL
jgi:hypothetical protein